MAEPVKITLARPIHAAGETLNDISLREPTGKDLVTCGYPFTIGQGGRYHFSGAELRSMIAACAGIPTSSVDQLAASDLNDCALVILGFFLGATRPGSTTDTTKSPASSAAASATSSS